MPVNMTPEYTNLLSLLDRPIAFHRVFVTITGSVLAGLMLSQAVYWHPRGSAGDNWFYKRQSEWEAETGLSRWEQETARKKLLQVKTLAGVCVWEEDRRDVPAKLYYRVNVEALFECILESGNATIKNVGIPQSEMLENHNQDRGEVTNLSAEKPQSFYTETTTDISAQKGMRPPQGRKGKQRKYDLSHYDVSDL